MLRRKLLTILFICILLPVLVILFQSATTIISQKKSTTEIAGRYVKNLAQYAADRWNDGNIERINAFLALVADQGYDRFIAIDVNNFPTSQRQELQHKFSMRGKFIPGLVAYVTADGHLLSYSQNAAILVNIYEKALVELMGRAATDGADAFDHIIGSLRIGTRNIAYVAHISPTEDPRVYAIAAVTMLSWMGKNDFNMLKLAFAGILGMMICLIALFLLRRSVITPLQTLSAQVEDLKWGEETPPKVRKNGVAEMQVEEISSLRKAIHDLAYRMIEKTELEKRYLGDIIKAQEDERGRIAQDIHDGPIQVLSALIQRIQITNITADGIGEDTRKGLVTAESIAQDLVEDLRDICDTLVPPWVSLGIVSCMEESANRFERQYPVQINLNVEQDLELPQEYTLALFRIFQEAVSNAVRHGHADEIDVEIATDQESGRIVFRIEDNGSGFDLSEEMLNNLMREGKRGLNGMRQRVELLGGEYALSSSPENGTSIVIRL